MEIIKGAKNGVALTFVLPLTDSASRPDYKASPTIALGDVKVARYDSAAWAVSNVALARINAITGLTTHLEVELTATEMTADDDTRPIVISFIDAAGAEWDDNTVEIRLGAMEADMTKVNGGATDGYNATLKLKQLDINNSSGDAVSLAAHAGQALVASTDDAESVIAVQSTSGRGVVVQSGGNYPAVELDGSGTAAGLELAGGGDNGSGCVSSGFGSGDGHKNIGGPTGHGTHSLGGSTSGDGTRSEAQTAGDGHHAIGAGNGHGSESTGQGTGHGRKNKGGAMANGVHNEGGASAGNGTNSLAPGNGDGFAATGEVGINAVSSSGGEAGIKARGTGALDIDASELTDIKAKTDNLPADPASDTNVDAEAAALAAEHVVLASEHSALSGEHTGIGNDIAALNNLSQGDVETAVDAKLTNAIAEPSVGVPASTNSVKGILSWVWMGVRNKGTHAKGSGDKVFHNAVGVALAKKHTTDDGTTYTEDEMSAV